MYYTNNLVAWWWWQIILLWDSFILLKDKLHSSFLYFSILVSEQLHSSQYKVKWIFEEQTCDKDASQKLTARFCIVCVREDKQKTSEEIPCRTCLFFSHILCIQWTFNSAPWWTNKEKNTVYIIHQMIYFFSFSSFWLNSFLESSFTPNMSHLPAFHQLVCMCVRVCACVYVCLLQGHYVP